MKTITVVLWTLLSMLVLTPMSAQEVADQASKDETADKVGESRQPKVEGWRYKWHNGHWWYYQPNKQWMFWNGLAWSPYSPEAYRGWYTNFRATGGGQYMTGYRGPYWYRASASPLYPNDPYWPYDAGAMAPSAHLGQAMTGGMSGPEAARTARVGENW